MLIQQISGGNGDIETVCMMDVDISVNDRERSISNISRFGCSPCAWSAPSSMEILDLDTIPFD